jgi:hypothetical protein
MEGPDQRLYDEDTRSAEFRMGVAGGRWGTPESALLPTDLAWPSVILSIAAAPRDNAPERFLVRLDMAGYRSVPPTGMFWDPASKSTLEFAKRPKGKPESRVARVFRTDWAESGRAFYHPYDRVAAQSHPAWPTEQPHLIWTASNTIVDYLTEFHALLNSGDYVGI